MKTLVIDSIKRVVLNLNDNYIITFLESSFTITERPVTVTAESKMKNFGDTDPGLTIITTSGRLIGR